MPDSAASLTAGVAWPPPSMSSSRAVAIVSRHTLHWYRILPLRILSIIHLYFVSSSFVYDRGTLRRKGHDALKRVDAAILLLALVSWATRHALFTTTHSFLGFRRPLRSYRLAVAIVSGAIIAANLVLHPAAIYLSSKTATLRPGNTGVIQTTLQLLFVIPISAIHIYLVRYYLLTDDVENYEPIYSPPRHRAHDLQALEVPEFPLEPYSDNENITTTIASRGALSEAYAAQVASSQPRILASRETETQGVRPESSPPEQPDPNQPAEQSCHTLARVDFMMESQTGLHVILTYPLVIWCCAACCFIIAALWLRLHLALLSLNHPFRNTKYALLMPLSGLLFCAYARNYQPKRSLFTRGSTSLPQPWTARVRLFGRTRFVNSETSTFTSSDPRIRTPLPRKRRDGLRQRQARSEYVKSYNAVLNPANATSGTSCLCESYWGHLGRKWITKMRPRPIFYRMLFIGTTLCLYLRGIIYMLGFPMSYKDFERFGELPGVTPEAVKRLENLVPSVLFAGRLSLVFGLILLIYAGWASMSMVVLYGRFAKEVKGVTWIDDAYASR
ncbi:hypothetical protein QBC34DRAFT_499270 [Podospora aff. communis PSN243]|uniref:WW domain-containing protein n=1 Tax=Podospora aff. communis PSN243 TaxID=3040156 RepID=A0AAV9G4G4_9PEZI|nr:hypothetical protein QBC34DRAFT_499270 [Podospora aff. communis PSN243]